MFCASVHALAAISIIKIVTNTTGITIGTLIGRSRSGYLKRRTIKPTVANKMPIYTYINI